MKKRKLAIISHTEHYKTADGIIVGWGPTISELNHLAQDFEEIYHVAVLHPGTPPPSSLPYKRSNIHFVPLKPSGGPRIGDKLKILTTIPDVLKTVRKTLKLVDVFQLRAPMGIGLFLIPYLTIFVKKKGWYKYAGNWIQEEPPLGYRLQRGMLKTQKRTVTINGKWTNQPSQCITFENPCLTLEERKEGQEIVSHKSYNSPFTFCFVGRLEDAKGVQHILDAFASLKNKAVVGNIHFIGNGVKFKQYEEEAKTQNIPATFHGFLSRDKVFDIYKKSHFLLLPSASEGFPKVIAEAMNFGCIPIVSLVSSIGQYVKEENGFLLEPCTAEVLYEKLSELSKLEETVLKNKAFKAYSMAESFTFENYRNRVLTEILK